MRPKISTIIAVAVLTVRLFSQNTPDFIYRQGYLFDPTTTGPDSIGVGAGNVLSIPGSDGAGVKMVDIETQGWYLNHEDLLPSGISYIFGDFSEDDHGTAVLGIIVGRADNAIGITGIAPA
ncbi:MAG: hypothetical protein GWN00_07915, partial [Aliifodinibius sp.]|nr:hypothetical protein [candidate division Zixibacteria bacterium]NIT56151.1 hypothetical protein [Fodinibius sp.]NIV05505.1 hypothetical protein [candidate division Zixibacteria bacterium]NIY24734.1 hypothetical protein [Fodinibius sp.]